MGALALSRAREALRPYGLFVSPGALRQIRALLPRRTIFLYGFARNSRVQPLRSLLPIVRSLAHLPEATQCPRRVFDAALTEPA